MKGFVKISVTEAAKVMQKSILFVYEGMKRGVLPIGEAMQMPGSTKWTYFISPPLLAQYLGVELKDLIEEVRRIRCETEATEDTAS